MRFRANRFVNTIAVLAILSTLILSATVVTATNDLPEESVTLSDYILRCYDADNPGYADMPGGYSTLESTLDAVELLMTETDTSDWSNGLRGSLDLIAERYSDLQSPYQYGFVHPDNEELSPNPKTTALVLETLSLIDRLDAVSLNGVCRYLEKSGKGISKYGLDLTRWATEGDFEYKYWLLRAAYAIDGTTLSDGTVIKSLKKLGVTGLSRDFVLSPEANTADFDLPEPYLVWDKELLSPSTIYGGGFEAESYTRRLALVDSYRMMLEDEVDGPTMLGMLIDTESFADEVLSYYDNELLMFQDVDGQFSLRATTDALETLATVGKIEDVFQGDWAAYDYADSITYWENGYVEWDELARTDSGSLADRKVISETSRLLAMVDDEKVTYDPVFGDDIDQTGITGWSEHKRTPWGLRLTDTFWEYYHPIHSEPSTDAKIDLGFLPLGILILLGTVFSFASDKRTLKGLSVLCIIFFVFQVVFMDTSIFDQMSSFVSSVIPPYNRPMADMIKFGTIYLEPTYPESTEPEEASPTEMFVPEVVNPYATSWAYTPTIPQLTLDGFTAFPHLLTTPISSNAVFFMGDYAIPQIDLMTQIQGLKSSSLVTLDNGIVISESAVRGCWEFNHMPHVMSIIGMAGTFDALLAGLKKDGEVKVGFYIYERNGEGATHGLLMLGHTTDVDSVSTIVEGKESVDIVHIVSAEDYKTCVKDMETKIERESYGQQTLEGQGTMCRTLSNLQ